MAKFVSVSPSPLKPKRFTFLWTVHNLCTGNRSFNTTLIPEDVQMPQWAVKVNAYGVTDICFRLGIKHSTQPGTNAIFQVSLVNKNEKLMIWETTLSKSDTKFKWTTSEIDNALLSGKGFSTQDQVMLMFEVDCVESQDNEAQSSAEVSLPDPPYHLSSGLAQLFDTKQCSDVTLNVGDCTITAHKAILIASSPVFAAMFQHDMQEQSLNSITIPDIGPEVLEEMLRYIYTGDIPHLDTMAEHLLKAADKYTIPNLKVKCEESLHANISIENAAYTLMIADRYNAEHLKKKSLEYVTANTNEIVETQGWEEMIELGTNNRLIGEAYRALALKSKV